MQGRKNDGSVDNNNTDNTEPKKWLRGLGQRSHSTLNKVNNVIANRLTPVSYTHLTLPTTSRV